MLVDFDVRGQGMDFFSLEEELLLLIDWYFFQERQLKVKML